MKTKDKKSSVQPADAPAKDGPYVLGRFEWTHHATEGNRLTLLMLERSGYSRYQWKKGGSIQLPTPGRTDRPTYDADHAMHWHTRQAALKYKKTSYHRTDLARYRVINLGQMEYTPAKK